MEEFGWGSYAATLLVGVPTVWASSEVLGSKIKPDRVVVAAVLGPIYSVSMVLIGFLPLIPSVFSNWWGNLAVNILFAVVSGLLITLGSQQLNERVMAPLGVKLKKGTPP